MGPDSLAGNSVPPAINRWGFSMVELDHIPQAARERLEQVGPTELVIGVLGDNRQGELDSLLPVVREAIGTLSPHVGTVVIHAGSSVEKVSGNSEPAVGDDSLRVLSYPLLAPETSADLVQSRSDAYRSLFAVSDTLRARACVVIASDSRTVTSSWICRLIHPVLEMDYDLVTPCYTHHKFEGLLNSSIISPLNRALYGRRIENPMGPDLALSKRATQRILGTGGKGGRDRPHPLASLAPTAVSGGFPVCQ